MLESTIMVSPDGHSVPAVRQKLHLASCADFRDRLSAGHRTAGWPGYPGHCEWRGHRMRQSEATGVAADSILDW